MDNSILYYFWGKGYADILPFLPKVQKQRSVVRFHGYDLYEERNEGYVPNQKSIVNAANLILSISQHGQKYLVSQYSNLEKKILCSMLGTTGHGLARASSDGILRIVSCAFVAPVKRLHLIPEALKLLRNKVIWTHIGGGEGLQALKKMTKTLPGNIDVNFLGNLKPNSITKLYAGGEFDLFLNVSSSEGLPVSIMEALSAGIPVLATDVGGTREIVDEKVGFLLPKALQPSNLASIINQYMQLSTEKKQEYKYACHRCYLEKLQATKLASELAKKIIHNSKFTSC